MKIEKIKTRDVARYTEDDYSNMINECYPAYEIGCCKFYPADILLEMDPVAYNCGFNEYQEYDEVYVCPVCGVEHDDEQDAIDCCCYQCECGDIFTTEEEAKNCCLKDDDN